MGSRIFRFISNFNKPIADYTLKKGMYFRLLIKYIKGMKFRKLSMDEKKAIRNYWKQYNKRVSPLWTAFYSYGSKISSEKYIPDSLYYTDILYKLNDFGIFGISNKNLLSLVSTSKQPKIFARKLNNLIQDENYNPISLDKVISSCINEGHVIIKPLNLSYGDGIVFWDDSEPVEKLKELIKSFDSCIIQEVVKSHKFFSDIHPASLNTLRVTTLIIDNEPVVLSTILRIGQKGKKVDNYSAGGVIAQVDKNGYLMDKTVQSDQNTLEKHPDGFVFKGQKVPFLERVHEEAKRQHYRLSFYRYISWDYTVNEEGIPVLIEFNGPKSQLDLHQLNIGPMFGEYTDRVLDFVYKNKDL